MVIQTIGAKVGDKSALLIQNVKTKVNAKGEFTNVETFEKFKGLIEDFEHAVTRPKVAPRLHMKINVNIKTPLNGC